MNHTVLVVPAGCYPDMCTASSGIINNGISSGASLNFTHPRPWLSPPSCLWSYSTMLQHSMLN